MLNRTYLKELQLLKENYKEDLVLVLGGPGIFPWTYGHLVYIFKNGAN